MRRLLAAAVILSAVLQGAAPDEFSAVILRDHNELRARHHEPPLVLDEALTRYAKDWARHLAASGTFRAHSHGPYGENLYFVASSSRVEETGAARAAVRDWAAEAAHYRYGDDFSSETGHFTQLIWKGSLRLGCAMARGEKDRLKAVYVVCSYDPPGNVQRRFRENVLP